MSVALAGRARPDLPDAPDAILGETLSGLRAGLGPDAAATVERVVIGLFFTGVKLSNGHGGVCFTPVKAIPEAVCCPSSARAMPTSGKLRGASASRLAEDALSDSPIRRAVGIATLNALSNVRWAREPPSGYTVREGVDPLDEVDLEAGAYAVVVGALVPYLKVLKRRGQPFCVLEKDPATLKADELPFYAPADRATEVVPRADLLIATGTTLLNGTLEGLLSLVRPDARVVVVGPTASMLPGAFFRRGVTMVGGIRVTRPDEVLDVLSEGGSGYHFFGKSAEKVLLTATA